MRRVTLFIGTAMFLLASPVRAEDANRDQTEVFGVLDGAGEKGETTLGQAVGTFDRALGKYESGELEAVRSNLEYNRKRLEDLKRQADAQGKYLETFWERVAVYFENLKARYGQDESNPAYRKAALSLQEEYQQREADARRELERLNTEISVVAERITDLEERERMAKLEQELRANNMNVEVAAEAEKKPLPSRADGALQAMGDLAKRKSDRRVARLASVVSPCSAREACFDELAEGIRKGE